METGESISNILLRWRWERMQVLSDAEQFYTRFE